MAAQVSVGDIFEIVLGTGVAYVSFAGKDAILGTAIWVVPTIFPTYQKDWTYVFSQKGYFVFYAIHTALRHRHLRRVGHSVDAIRWLPVLRRNAIQTDNVGHVTRWLITDGKIHLPKNDSDLTLEERCLPISDMWNHKYLVAKIQAGWMPNDGDASFANSGL